MREAERTRAKVMSTVMLSIYEGFRVLGISTSIFFKRSLTFL